MFHRKNSKHPSDHWEWKSLARDEKNATMLLTFSSFLGFAWLLFSNPRVKLRSQYSCSLNSFTYKSSCWSSRYTAGFFTLAALRKVSTASSVSRIAENASCFYTTPFHFCTESIYLCASLQFQKLLKIQ